MAKKKDAPAQEPEQPTAGGGVGPTFPEKKPDPDEYHRRPPSQGDIAAAKEVWNQMVARADEYTPEATIEALVQVVDVLPEVTAKDEWPGKEKEEYHDSLEIREIASALMRGCRSVLNFKEPKKVMCLWRNKEKWTKDGETVAAAPISFNRRVQFITGGVLCGIEVNFHHWKTLNPLQKVHTVFDALQQLTSDGSVRTLGFIDYAISIELFGTNLYRKTMRLAAALATGQERTKELPFQLGLKLEEDAA